MHLSYRPVRQAWCHSTARSGRAKLQLTCASPQFIRAERLSHLHGRRPLAWLRSGIGGHAVRTAAVAHLPWHTITFVACHAALRASCRKRAACEESMLSARTEQSMTARTAAGAAAAAGVSASLSVARAEQQLAATATPITKVIELLKEMKAENEKEAKQDQEIYDKMACIWFESSRLLCSMARTYWMICRI